MPLTVFLIASGIFLWLGVVHAVLLLRDLRGPRAFTPTDPSVRDAMAEAPLALAPQTTVWRAWLGFNLSHSLGLIIFGGLLGALALRDFAWLRASPAFRWGPPVVALLYAVLASLFWFRVPALAAWLGCALFLAAAVLR